MVSKNDVGFHKADNSGFGGSKSSFSIVSNAENNYFDEVTAADQVGGHTEYRVFYVVNEHATEKMEDVDIWMSEDNKNSAFSTYSWAIDPIAQHPLWPFTGSLFFDGTDDFVDLGNHASLWSQGLTKFSFTFWIFPTAAGDGNERAILTHGEINNHGFVCNIDSVSSVRIEFKIRNAVGTVIEAANTSLNLNQWNFVACTYDKDLGSANLKIYVNNILGATTGDLTETINLSTSVLLGGGSNDFQGYLKDFRWFTTKALSVSQIDDLFKGEDDAVGANYWQLINESTSSGTITDEIGALTGTINGGEIRTSQEIPNSVTSPFGVTWLGVTNGPVGNEPNLGDIAANQNRQCPIWVRNIIQDTEQDEANDYCVFTVQGKIPQGGTAPPPSGGGGDPVPAPAATDFTFAACGDWGTESMTRTVVNLIKNNNPRPKVVVGVGDNAYGSGSSEVNDWIDIIDPIDDKNGIRFETAFGNHDNAESESDSNESTLKNHFGYSNTYHMFDYENVRFIAIDNTTETSFGVGSSQYNKVKEWLTNGRKDPDIDWIVVYAHKPMFGGDSEHGYNSGNFNQAYFPLFDQHKVDLMLFGHNHHMAQSKQVKYNSNDAESPTVVDSSTPYTGGAGRIHCIIGTGGHDADDLYEVDSFSQTEWSNDTDHGALFVTITNGAGTTTLTGRFKDTDGSTLRTFVINRTT